jgi:hypothetical protein
LAYYTCRCCSGWGVKHGESSVDVQDNTGHQAPPYRAAFLHSIQRLLAKRRTKTHKDTDNFFVT